MAALVGRDSTFRREVDVTSGRLSLSELLRNIARASGVNVSVRGVFSHKSRFVHFCQTQNSHSDSFSLWL